MKNLKLCFDKNDVKFLLGRFSILSLALTVGVTYYLHEDKNQVLDSQIEFDDSDTYLDENGEICCNFVPGEHRIMISRNDIFPHEMDSIDGYIIESIKTNAWRDNCQITYVNIELVTVKGEEHGDGTVTFDEFGEVITKDSIKAMGSK